MEPPPRPSLRLPIWLSMASGNHSAQLRQTPREARKQLGSLQKTRRQRLQTTRQRRIPHCWHGLMRGGPSCATYAASATRRILPIRCNANVVAINTDRLPSPMKSLRKVPMRCQGVNGTVSLCRWNMEGGRSWGRRGSSRGPTQVSSVLLC